MFDATIVPLKGLFGTFILLAVFVVLFIVMIGTFELQEPKFFLIPVVFSVGLALLRSIRIINEIIKGKEDDLVERNMQVFLNTCPEYWIKDTVNLVDSDTSDVSRVNICKNYSKDQDGKIQFVGGSGEKFAQNFKGTHTLDATTAEGKMDEVITNLNAEFPPQTEGFQQPEYLHSSDLNRITRGNPNDLEDDRMVTYVDTANDEENLGRTEQLHTLSGKHIHYKGNAIMHDNNSGDIHEDVSGYGWHVHDTHHLSGENVRTGDNYSSNWINRAPDSTGSHGVEINLDRLNEADNKCQLAKHFYWTEARNKCATRVNNQQ
jgi:hypothetical protein